MGALARSAGLVESVWFCWEDQQLAAETCCDFGRHLQMNWMNVLLFVMEVTVARLVSTQDNIVRTIGVRGCF